MKCTNMPLAWYKGKKAVASVIVDFTTEVAEWFSASTCKDYFITWTWRRWLAADIAFFDEEFYFMFCLTFPELIESKRTYAIDK